MTKKREFTISEGEYVIVGGKKMWVNEVMYPGREKGRDKKGGKIAGEKSDICACIIMADNGQILKRSPKYIGTSWDYA